MGIGNIGWTEFIVILAIALIFFGPRRLPGIAQSLGKSLREFQKALNEVKSEIVQAGQDADTRSELKRILPRPADLINTHMDTPPASDTAEPETTKESAATTTPLSPNTAPGTTPHEPESEDADPSDKNVS